MREDGCRLSDATPDKYLCAALLFPPAIRPRAPLSNREVSARIFRGSFKGAVHRVSCLRGAFFFFFLFFLFYFTGSRDEGIFDEEARGERRGEFYVILVSASRR